MLKINSLLLPPNHLINHTSIALNQLYNLRADVFVGVCWNWYTIIFILYHLNSYIYCLEKVVLVDSCKDKTSLIKCLHLYEANGMSVEMHGNHIANLHLLGATGIDGKYFERGLLHPMLDYEVPKPWFTELYDRLDENGNVIIPQDPGLGYKFNWDYI